MSDRFVRLSRMIAHALRHHPERYGLVLDKDGWAPLGALIGALARDAEWVDVSVDDVYAMIATAAKQRYEIHGPYIRAIYGHSLAAKIEHVPAGPPDRLYHGTTPSALVQIRRDGLKPMRRQYVHLSMDAGTAETVAGRRTKTPAIITVHAKEAHRDGVIFHCSNDQVWLAERIIARYLSFPEDLELGRPVPEPI